MTVTRMSSFSLVSQRASHVLCILKRYQSATKPAKLTLSKPSNTRQPAKHLRVTQGLSRASSRYAYACDASSEQPCKLQAHRGTAKAPAPTSTRLHSSQNNDQRRWIERLTNRSRAYTVCLPTVHDGLGLLLLPLDLLPMLMLMRLAQCIRK